MVESNPMGIGSNAATQECSISRRRLFRPSIPLAVISLGLTANPFPSAAATTKARHAASHTDTQIKALNEQNAQLIREMTKLQGELRMNSESLAQSRTELDRFKTQTAQAEDTTHSELKAMQESAKTSLKLSHEGAFFLLLGMFFEIIGATLLAGVALGNKQMKLSSLAVTHESYDFGMEDEGKEAVLNYLGMIGTFFLVFGFLFQTAGTMLTLQLHWLIQAGVLLLGIAVSSSLIWLLAGQSPDQNLSEKFATVLWNSKRFLLSLRDRNHDRRCEVCLKPLELEDAHVCWYGQENLKDHPYLYSPHRFKLGHLECVKSDLEAHQMASKMSLEKKKEIAVHYKFESAKSFLILRAQQMQDWFDARAIHNETTFGKKKNSSKHKAEFETLVGKIKRLRPT